jgi:hypothetical protein
MREPVILSVKSLLATRLLQSVHLRIQILADAVFERFEPLLFFHQPANMRQRRHPL